MKIKLKYGEFIMCKICEYCGRNEINNDIDICEECIEILNDDRENKEILNME